MQVEVAEGDSLRPHCRLSGNEFQAAGGGRHRDIRTQLDISLLQVEVVEGDILRPRCGLSGDDLRRLSGIGVIVHAAASVCFTSPVRESLQHNYHVR